MRTILRKTNLGLFFQGPDQWTEDPVRAFNFKSIDRALRFIETWQLRDVEVAFSFKDSTEIKTFPAEKVRLDYSKR